MKYKNLDLAQLTDDEALFFVRIHGKKGIFGQYYPTPFLNEFENVKQYKTISEYECGDVYINLENTKIESITNEEFDLFSKILDTNDLIYRCRGLRNIPIAESQELIWKAAKFFNDYFSSNKKLKVIVSLIVDNYVMSIMEAFANHFNIASIQVIGFFVPGYHRLTEKGIGVSIREIGNEEVNSVYTKLVQKSKSHYAIGKNIALKRAFRDYISFRFRFVQRYLINYKLKGKLSYENRFAPYFKGCNTLKKTRIKDYFNSVEDITGHKDEYIFIPLHYHPEATVDYWTDKYVYGDYLNSLIPIIAFCKSKGLKVILKEHPGYYLRRSIEFYKLIQKMDDVILLNPFVSSQSVYDLADNVCVYTGSAGVEAIMLDKRVYTVSENYYSFKRLPHLETYEKEKYPFYSEKEKKNLLKEILSSTIKS